MRKLFCSILFFATCLLSSAQPKPVDFESVFRPKENSYPLPYLQSLSDPYSIDGLRINGNDWEIAVNYDFRKFKKLEFVEIKCKPDELHDILEKLSELPVLRKLVIAELLLSWEPGIIGDSIPFPESIRKLKSLTAIQFDFLRSYNWNSIAMKITYLPFLQHLSIRGLFTDYIDSAFQGLDQLVSLQITGGPFLRLPEWLDNFHKLEFLDISHNQKLDYADAFKTIAKLPSLRILKINQARIESLPASFGNLHRLEKLYANTFYSKNFDEFFQICGRLKNLKFLELDNGDQLSLPPSIGLLSSLEYLSLNERKLTSIPLK